MILIDFNDRFVRGFAAGIVGGIVQNVFDVISNLMKIDELTFFDWAGIAIYGSKPNNLLEYSVAIFGQFLFAGLLGIIFAYFIPQVTSKNIIIKGVIFGLTTWFVLFIIPLLFKIKELMETHAISSASDAVTALIYGFVVALTLNWLDKRQKI